MDTLRVLWEGADGSSWDLLDPLGPVHLSRLEGIGGPMFSHQWTKSGARDGRRWEGTLWDVGSLVLTVSVGYLPGNPKRVRGDDWRELDARWRDSLDAEREGRLTVISGAGQRHMSLRLEAPVPMPSYNAAEIGEYTYIIALTAGDEPWWIGPEISREFSFSEENAPFFGGPSGTSLLYISSVSTASRASITNPGYRDAWPKWWVEGPFESVRLGVGSDTFTLPFSLGVGRKVFVDSYAQTIVNLDGSNLWPLMGFTDPTFAPIPGGTSVPLTVAFINADDGAKAGISILPRYKGPW